MHNFDEVLYAPELIPYIKERIDADRGNHGKYLFTGSQNLFLMERLTESLAHQKGDRFIFLSF